VEVALPTLIAAGRYRLEAVLGVGGMARVYRAFDLRLEVERAIKVIPVDGVTSRGQIERLAAEARVMARLDHPGILQVHDVGLDDRFHFVVMDLASGGSLADDLRAGPMSPEGARDAVTQVLAALGAAHAAGVVHRDVKPQNVLIGPGGRYLLADFGIALLIDDDRRLTRTNVAMGSVAYMAPEQRLDAKNVGVEADIYASAATLFNLLTNETPIDLFTAGIGSPRWEGVPEPLIGPLVTATRLEPERRFSSAAAFSEALTALGPLSAERPAPRRPGGAGVTRSATGSAPAAPSAPTSMAGTVAPTMPAPMPPGTLAGRTLLPWAESRSWRLAPVAIAVAVVLGLGGAVAARRGLVDAAPSSMAPPVVAAEAPAPTGAAAVGSTEVPVAGEDGGMAVEPAIRTSSPAPTAVPPPAPRAAPPRTPPRVAVEAAPSPAVVADEAGGDGEPFPPHWTGSFAGSPAKLTLTGARQVSGAVLVGREPGVSTRVRGRFEPRTGSLRLEDVDDIPDAGNYAATLSADGERLTGTFTRRDGSSTVPFAFRRVGR
jgi:tRNA A-37 threonylcarbamoyl transferase component Bud32